MTVSTKNSMTVALSDGVRSARRKSRRKTASTALMRLHPAMPAEIEGDDAPDLERYMCRDDGEAAIGEMLAERGEQTRERVAIERQRRLIKQPERRR